MYYIILNQLYEFPKVKNNTSFYPYIQYQPMNNN